MPQTAVIHQNMRAFNGFNIARSNNFQAAFQAIAQGMAFQEPIVAGFTELKSNGFFTEISIGRCAAEVMIPGTTYDTVIIPVGYTVLLRTPEYIGITYDSRVFTPYSAGQALKVGNNWQVFTYPLPANAFPLPNGVTPDIRGLAFINGDVGNTHYVFAFAHNVYRLSDRVILMQRLPAIADLIRQAINDDNAIVVIGGDFNVPPRNRNGAVPLQAIAAMGANNNFIMTTRTNCFDYWFTPQNWPGNPNPIPSVMINTRAVGLSDHAAVELKFTTP